MSADILLFPTAQCQPKPFSDFDRALVSVQVLMEHPWADGVRLIDLWVERDWLSTEEAAALYAFYAKEDDG